MNLKHLPLGAGLAALALAAGMAVPAGAADELHASAIKACSSASAHGPATVVTAIGDGRGGSLVWLTDADANLWLCSADTDGHIYAYPMITGDLLNGAGANLVNIDQATDDGTLPEHDPLDVAERACQASLSEGPGNVVGSGKDGLTGDWIPGYFVFIETGAGTYLCDATADAQVWAFAEIGDPLTFGHSVN
ncbi:MAG TPA: hypothetical protein VGN85_03290 [Methyloceanibacter sp.]|jgi:hypothetical protein|nr:hypothetical protein [Methyloceanibacter sp.]